MSSNQIIDDIGEDIIDGRTGERKLVLLSEEGPDVDIVNSTVINAEKNPELITRYGSNKADE